MRAAYRVGVGKVSRYSFWWNSEYVPGPAKFSRDMARRPELAPCWLLSVVVCAGTASFEIKECCVAARSLEVCASFGTHLNRSQNTLYGEVV
jgi:hypothetical protein